MKDDENILEVDLRNIVSEVWRKHLAGNFAGGAYESFALDVARRSAAFERDVCARLCDQIAEDIMAAMRKEGESDSDYMKSIVASARLCAEEIRGGCRP